MIFLIAFLSKLKTSDVADILSNDLTIHIERGITTTIEIIPCKKTSDIASNLKLLP
jgi:hypothetical protein